jgi:ABC-type transport system involved in multi-copper enzyme maturation permease subunit
MRGVIVALAVVLAGFQFLLTQVASYLMRTQAFGMLSTLLPEFVRSMAVPSMLVSFAGVVCLGYFHPIVIAAMIGLAIAIATEPAAEIETRFVDLALSRPIARTELVTRTLIVLAVCGMVTIGMMVAATAAGLACCMPATALGPSAGVIRSLAGNLAAITWSWSGVTLAVAAAVKRRATAAGVAGTAALAAYLLDYLGRAWEPARLASRLSPFHYFEPLGLIAGGSLSGSNLAVLFGIGLVGVGLSYFILSRRDL